MAEIVLAVMAVATVAYVTLGGADFGAGMVEPFLRRWDQERVSAAIAPVWEANHVWLVLVAVLAFVGFPRLYAEVSTQLHVPLLFILLGVVARGSAFVFRHYDPEPGALQTLYSAVFRVSSAGTPLFLGIVVAAMVDGRIGGCAPSRGFFDCYVAPWNTWFGWTTGLFLCALFAFQGAALLAAEHPRAGRRALPYTRLSRRLHLATIVLGGTVLLAATVTGSPWARTFWESTIGPVAMVSATLLVPAVAYAFHNSHPQLLRLLVGAQSGAILLGLFGPAFPVLLRLSDGRHVMFPEDAAPGPVLEQLVIAVSIGFALIVPGMVYLIAVYKGGPTSAR